MQAFLLWTFLGWAPLPFSFHTKTVVIKNIEEFKNFSYKKSAENNGISKVTVSHFTSNKV